MSEFRSRNGGDRSPPVAFRRISGVASAIAGTIPRTTQSSVFIHGLTRFVGLGPFFVSGSLRLAPLVPTCVPSSIVAGDTVRSRARCRTIRCPRAGCPTSRCAARRRSTSTGPRPTMAVVPDHAPAGKTGALARRAVSVVALGGARGRDLHRRARRPHRRGRTSYTVKAGDLVSSAERELALCETQIAELLASRTESYTIGQRSAQKRALAELTTLRGVLIAKLGRERGQPLPSHAIAFRAPR
jgi:hypothetical protein